MYKLYNIKTWGSVSAHLLLEELEVPYTNLWMTAEQVRKPEFREISPLGFLPALGLSDGRTLFESAAIVTFLVCAHEDKGLAPPAGSNEFGEFLSWLNFMSANLYATIDLALGGSSYALDAAQDRHIVSLATGKADQQWGLLENRLLAEGPWLMGAQFSALDIYAFMLSLWGRPDEAALHRKFPRIARLAQDVRERPKLKAALVAHGIMEIGGYNTN